MIWVSFWIQYRILSEHVRLFLIICFSSSRIYFSTSLTHKLSTHHSPTSTHTPTPTLEKQVRSEGEDREALDRGRFCRFERAGLFQGQYGT